MALALLAVAPEEPAARSWRLDVPMGFTAQSPTSGVETRVVPWMGLRAARLLDHQRGELLLLGGDATFWLGSGPSEGTSVVRSSRFSGALEGRGLVGLNAFETATAGIRPYLYGSVVAGGGLVTLSAYADRSMVLVPVWGLGTGAGVELTTHLASLRVELGGGLRDGGFALSSSLAAGVAF